MVLVDYSSVAAAYVGVAMNKGKGTIPLPFFRHLVLNGIRMLRVKFGVAEWGQLVLACDGGDYWRTALFPYYKARRRAQRERTGIDWRSIYTNQDIIRDEIRRVFHYPVICVPHCEADDIIAVLCHRFGEPTVIVSRDEDFKQLQVLSHVSQYDQIGKRFIKAVNPVREAEEFFLNGDPGDGVPNVMSPDDCFVSGTMQTALTQAQIHYILNTAPDMLDVDLQGRIARNRQLLDLTKLPVKYMKLIAEAYTRECNKLRDEERIRAYMQENKLRQLEKSIEEF